MPIQAVLFDHDGTLVDSEPAHYAMWAEILSAYGAELTPEHYKTQYAGSPSLANAYTAIDFFKLQGITAQDLARQKKQATTSFTQTQAYPLMPGVSALLEHLHKKGFRLGVVTGAEAHEVDITLRMHQLAPYFETVVCANDVARNKPAPDPYLLALKRLQLPPQACIAIEDTAFGLQAAVDAGIRTLAVPHAFTHSQDFSRASAVLTQIKEVEDWITQQIHA